MRTIRWRKKSSRDFSIGLHLELGEYLIILNLSSFFIFSYRKIVGKAIKKRYFRSPQNKNKRFKCISSTKRENRFCAKSKLNVQKFYEANVLYRGALLLSLFHAAMRTYDCVTFYLILLADQFFIMQKKGSFLESREEKSSASILTRFRLRNSHKLS